MSLSTCTERVRIISPNGNLLSEGETKCSDITTLRNLGYTIESLEELKEQDSTTSSFEVIQEPKVQTLVIQQQDIFDNSLILAETNATLKANNIELTNKVSNLEQELTTVTTQEELNKILLDNEIKRVHNVISASHEKVNIHPKPDGRELHFNRWSSATKAAELELELFANKLGLEYTRRDRIQNEPFYYTAPPVEEHQSYVPTSSATIRDF